MLSIKTLVIYLGDVLKQKCQQFPPVLVQMGLKDHVIPISQLIRKTESLSCDIECKKPNHTQNLCLRSIGITDIIIRHQNVSSTIKIEGNMKPWPSNS